MMKRALVFGIVGGLLLAACADDRASAPTTTSEDHELNVMDVKCRSESLERGSSFDLTPVSVAGRTVLEGVLTDDEGLTTVYTCRPTAFRPSDGGAGGSVVTCTERDANERSGRWTVEIVRTEKQEWQAKIDRARLEPGEVDVDLLISCATIRSGTTAPRYATIAPYVHRACGGCHGDKFDSLAKIKEQQSIMLGMISSGAMPRRDPTWKDSEEGLAVLAFLAKSPELQ